jgi:hypothetical protein
MKPQKETVQRLWYKAKLTPIAAGLFTDAFYPTPKRGSGAQFVFFTQIDTTPSSQKVVVASKLSEAGLRMMTRDLAEKCLIPGEKATKAEMATLNELSKNLKV